MTVSAPPAVRDRFGLLWRDEIAASVILRAGEIDLVEVIADDWFFAPRRRLGVLRALKDRVPVTLHATSLGLASHEPADARRIDAMARLVGAIEPDAWSEHLAFVRGGGVEIGHLAAPPRTPRSVAGLARNVERARRAAGSAPRLENVATLVDPPASTMDEASWLADCLAATGCDLLLDLHNLHANAVNFGFDAARALDRLPLERVAQVHVAGGRWIAGGVRGDARRLLDDHLHDVPDPVFDLLRALGARCPRSLTVVLERDGDLPTFDALMAQLARARAALAEGRAAQRAHAAPTACVQRSQTTTAAGDTRGALASESALDALLARVYVDPVARRRFLADPVGAARDAGVGDATARRLTTLDRDGVAFAAASLGAKRARRAPAR